MKAPQICNLATSLAKVEQSQVMAALFSLSHGNYFQLWLPLFTTLAVPRLIKQREFSIKMAGDQPTSLRRSMSVSDFFQYMPTMLDLPLPSSIAMFLRLLKKQMFTEEFTRE